MHDISNCNDNLSSLYKRLFKHTGAIAAYYTGMTKLCHQIMVGPKPLIITYHEIYDQEDEISWCNLPSLVVNKTLFQKHLEYIAKKYKIVSLDEIAAAPAPGLAAITFDDGYVGVYRNAFPILKNMGITATVFLTTGHIGSYALPWWEKVVEQIKCLLSLPYEKRLELLRKANHKWGSIMSEDASWISVLQEYKNATYEKKRALDEMLSALPIESKINDERLFMTESEIQEMHSTGITFGAHTVSHAILPWLDNVSLEKELQESKATVEKLLNLKNCWFSYPDGTFTSREQMFVEKVGFMGAVQTSKAPANNGRYALQRISLVTDNTTGHNGTFSKYLTEMTLAGMTKKNIIKLLKICA